MRSVQNRKDLCHAESQKKTKNNDYTYSAGHSIQNNSNCLAAWKQVFKGVKKTTFNQWLLDGDVMKLMTETMKHNMLMRWWEFGH